MTGNLRVGEKAPDFSLQAQDGRTVSLHDYNGKKNVVLYFYPKDFTMGCTAEAKSFSDSYEELQELDAEVMGVSSDSSESHRSFGEECAVRFILLSDPDGRVRNLYGVRASMGLIPGRVTYVIDREGFVRHVFGSQMRPTRHVSEAKEALKALN